jgi:predicted lipoprotein with Yx(FWY)xxD motif
MNKRRATLCVAVLTLALTGAALAATHPATIKLRKTTIGRILVTGSGFTVYMFTADKKNTDRCVRIASCTSLWPPVTTAGKPIAGAGVKASLLGRIKLPGGKSQVTYAGHSLYTYSGDASPGQTDYVSFPMFGGNWDALNAAGKAVK